MNKNAKVGRRAAVIKFPKASFTIASLKTMNPNVCMLTIRTKVKAGLASKKLVQLDKNVETNNAGRPAFRFTLRSNVKKNRKSTKNSSKVVSIPTPEPALAAAA